MIFLTGDVHSMELGGGDQRWLEQEGGVTEVDCALKYADIARRHEVPVALFVTGRAAETEPTKVERLASNPYVSIGGHTWNSLQPDWRHLAFWHLFGSYYGPRIFQRRDVEKTLDALGSVVGRRPTMWRTHSYRGDETTFDVLADSGVEVVSEPCSREVRPGEIRPELYAAPINIPPDHEHVEHPGHGAPGASVMSSLEPWVSASESCRLCAERLEERVKDVIRRLVSFPMPPRPFGEKVVPVEEWVDWVLEEVDERRDAGVPATVLAHPACMEIVDGMEVFEKLVEALDLRGVYDLQCYGWD